MDNLKEYFSLNNLESSFKQKWGPYRNPHFNFKYNCIFFPKFYYNLSPVGKSLIMTHESQHAADCIEVFFLMTHYINEMIANFNYYCGSFHVEDFKSIESNNSYLPPINSLSDDQFNYLIYLTEGLPVINRLVKYLNEKNEEENNLWELKRKYLIKESPYDYGSAIYYKVINDIGFDGSYDPSFQCLLNNILSDSYYDQIFNNIGIYSDDNGEGVFIKFIDPPDYLNVIQTLYNLDKKSLMDHLNKEAIVKKREKIYNITKKICDILSAFDEASTSLENDYDVYGKGTLSCIRYILNLLCDIQGIFLDIYKKGNINDIPALRYYWGNASIKFYEDVTHYDFFDFTNPDELSHHELYKNISRYVKGCIDKLESKSEIPLQHYFLLGMYLTHYRNRFIEPTHKVYI